MKRRIGIYPGTFDPVHQGHISFCLEAANQLALDSIMLLPEREPRNKYNISLFSERVEWLMRAAAMLPLLEVRQLKSRRFTVADTLPELKRLVGKGELTLLIGSDVARHLHTWDNLRQLLENVDLAIGMRTADSAESVRDQMERIGQKFVAVQYTLIKTEYAGMASSQIRASWNGKAGQVYALPLPLPGFGTPRPGRKTIKSSHGCF